MNSKKAYKIWAPSNVRWSGWVRPVPFLEAEIPSGTYLNFNANISAADYVDDAWKDAAIIVDLPGVESVREGLALAKVGFRPIPIFNGTVSQTGARAVVDNQSVGRALVIGAEKLALIEISQDAPPAFLIDSNRLNRYRVEPSLFDNSWDVYPQDLPSVEYLQKYEIKKIIIIGDDIHIDLKKILYDFQKKKMEIFLAKRYGKPKKVILRKPIQWKNE